MINQQRINMIRHVFFLQAIIGLTRADLRDGDQFRVRRRVHNDDMRMLNTDDFFLTFSDDGKSKTLEPFILELYETPSQLQDDAIPVLRMAMNKFLLAEINAIFSPQDYFLESVGSEIMWYSSTTRNGRRALQETGTELEMEVTMTFDSEPSPQTRVLEENTRVVMTNLQYFVGNLTSFQHSDWMDVTEAYRRELATPSPTATPEGTTDSIQQPDDNKSSETVDDKNNVVGAVVPTTLVAATLVALVAFLFVQRRSRTNDETQKEGNNVFVGVENDLYSMDRSLESSRSPLGLLSPATDSNDYSTSGASGDGSVHDDSVFSGIDYSSSNYTNVRGTKSLLSGITNASASTIRASNMDKKEREMIKNMATEGSLFAFGEEEEAYTEDDQNSGNLGILNLGNSDVSEDSNRHEPTGSVPPSEDYHQQGTPSQQTMNIDQAKSSYLSCYGSQPPTEPGSSSHVLADLEVLASSRAPSPRPDPSPTSEQQNTGILSYNIFNCNPAPPRATEMIYAKNFRLDGTAYSETDGNGHTDTPINRSFLACGPPVGTSSTKTPLTRNTDATAMTPRTTSSHLFLNSQTSPHVGGADRHDWDGNRNALYPIGTMSGKATRVIGGVYKADGSLMRDRMAMSVDDSAIILGQHCKAPPSRSKSAPSSPERNRFKGNNFAKIRSMPMHDFDYTDNLSRPSTPGGDLDSPRLADYDNSGYGCYAFRQYATQSAPGEDPPGNGRRHVGNTGIDGTAMYQTNAMHPLDWSYKSADFQSVGGESVLSENDGAAMPRQFLFGGSKRSERTATSKSPGREPRSPKTPQTTGSQKSGKSNQTAGSSQASASRQLINDLVWLERKIADVRQGSTQGPPGIATVDSLSYVSDDNEEGLSVSSRDESEGDPTISTGKNESVMSSIVCRDCYAPPGKLHIVIHSTKDGPAVHTVKQGSSLEGHIFPGDLIISVDNVDTRSFTAEQVMKMMASKSNNERKITVLHFEDED